MRIICVALLFGAVKGASFLAAEPESEAQHYFNRRDSTDRELAEINDEIHAAEQNFVKDMSKPTSFLQVADSEEHHYFNKKDPTDMQLSEIEDQMHAAEEAFASGLTNASIAMLPGAEALQSVSGYGDHHFNAHPEEDQIDAEISDESLAQDLADPYSLTFLQVGAKPEPEEHYFNSRDPTDRELKKIDDEIHAAEENFVKDMSKGSTFLKEQAEPKEESEDDKEVDAIKYDKKEFAKDWASEWKNGDYPSYKETYSKDAFPGRKAVVAAEDSQSDGKPGPAGLSGPNVGAHLKHEADGTITR